MLNAKTIGNKIATARKNANLSQAELAQQVSISPQAVGKWERGESLPDIGTLNRLAGLFGLDLNYFSDTVAPEINNAFSTNAPKQADSTLNENSPKKKFDWNWDMSKGNWADADFSGLKDLKETFGSANIKNCKFIGSDLSALTLEKNNIEACDFSGSELRGSNLKSSNLLNNRFINCSFVDAAFVKNNIEKCDFSGADFSGAELQEVNFENNNIQSVQWKFTLFKRSNLSNLVFSGQFENCHFEACSFYNVKFENATIINSFFKYNDRFKKVQFVNCTVDKLTYAFLKNNGANLSGIRVMD